jgi:hypothetical protein
MRKTVLEDGGVQSGFSEQITRPSPAVFSTKLSSKYGNTQLEKGDEMLGKEVRCNELLASFTEGKPDA